MDIPSFTRPEFVLMRAQNICRISGAETRRGFPTESASPANSQPSAGGALWFSRGTVSEWWGRLRLFPEPCLGPAAPQAVFTPRKMDQLPPDGDARAAVRALN